MYKKKLRHKFHAIPTEINNIKFPSKLEGRYYSFLRGRQDVLFFLRQIPIELPGGIRYMLDFMVFYKNGDIEFVEVKGMETPEWKLKKKLVEATYPFRLTVIKKVPK